jgi:hypothetical protein
MIAWEYVSADDAIAAGRDPAFLGDALWPDHIIEVEPAGASDGSIIWEWHAWDHLIQDFDETKENYGIVADHPELIDLNYPRTAAADWLHFNSVAYNEELDQIVISSPRFGELWIIDHSTTTEEAAGHTGGARGRGGDLLYRWGNPQSYGRGTADDQKLFFQHDPDWIPDRSPGAGNILLFNNGNGRPEGSYSSVEEIVTTVDANGDYPMPPAGLPHGPAEAWWTYTATPEEDFYSGAVSGAQRLPNGNTLICEGMSGRLFEVDSNGEPLWAYVTPVNVNGPQRQGSPPVGNATFRALRYGVEYPAFFGRGLTPGAPIELYPTFVAAGPVEPARFTLAQNYPNPFAPATTIGFSLRDPAPVVLDVYNVAGQRVATLMDRHLGVGEHRYTWRPDRLPSGVYHYTLRVGAETATRKMIHVR